MYVEHMFGELVCAEFGLVVELRGLVEVESWVETVIGEERADLGGV